MLKRCITLTHLIKVKQFHIPVEDKYVLRADLLTRTQTQYIYSLCDGKKSSLFALHRDNESKNDKPKVLVAVSHTFTSGQ